MLKMRRRILLMVSKNQENPIRPSIKGAVIVQDISPVNPSDVMKIILQQGWRVSTLFKKGHHFSTLFQEI